MEESEVVADGIAGEDGEVCAEFGEREEEEGGSESLLVLAKEESAVFFGWGRLVLGCAVVIACFDLEIVSVSFSVCLFVVVEVEL